MAVAVLIATLAMAVAGYGLAKSLPASQVASVDLLVLPNQQGSVDEALVRTFENLLAADVFAARIQESATIAEVQQLTAAEVAASISTARSPTSSLIEVVVTRPDESTALAIAQMISPTVDEVLTVGGVNASEFYQQIFPEPFVREQASISASLTTAIGGFLGFLVGILGVLVWSLRRPVVTTVADIEDLSGYPIIARLPARTAWWRRQQPNILDPLAAAVSQVQSTGLTSEGGVVAVVSPEVETGARFAIEFSALLAQGSDHPVFLVDGDYRRAELTGRLGADHVEGWDRLELTNGPTVTGLSAEVLGSFPPVSSELSGDGGAQTALVPVAQAGCPPGSHHRHAAWASPRRAGLLGGRRGGLSAGPRRRAGRTGYRRGFCRADRGRYRDDVARRDRTGRRDGRSPLECPCRGGRRWQRIGLSGDVNAPTAPARPSGSSTPPARARSSERAEWDHRPRS